MSHYFSSCLADISAMLPSLFGAALAFQFNNVFKFADQPVTVAALGSIISISLNEDSNYMRLDI